MNPPAQVRRGGHAVALAAALATLIVTASTAAATSNTWTAVSSMSSAREQHTATLLGSGKVLVTGGQNGSTTLSSAETYDPSTNSWSSAASMSVARVGHTATLLNSGRVLVVGAGSAETYDPVGNSWTGTGALAYDPGSRFTATPLANGKVLVAGGDANLGTTSAELYDPSSNAWTLTGNMGHIRFAHVAVRLASGSVLVAGGYTFNFLGRENTSELYDPSTGAWSLVPGVTYGPTYATATLLSNGQVLMAGGQSCATVASATVMQPPLPTVGVCPTPVTQPLAEVYDPAANTWLPTSPMSTARARFAATLLSNGQVLVEGGQTLGSVTGPTVASTAELYTPAGIVGTVGTWSQAATMTTSRRSHTATLENGAVLVVGGVNLLGSDQPSAEAYTP